MAGRRAGFLVVILALVMVVAGRATVGHRVAGAAAAITVPGPPRPGDCVHSAPDPALLVSSGLTADPSVVTGPCEGAVVGEIVSVTAGQSVPDGSIGSLMGTSGACWAAASQYAGLATDDGVARLPKAAPSTVDWRPDLGVRGQRVGADRLQQAVGQRWSACVVRPLTLASYTGSIRGALSDGVAPSEYGNCSTASDPGSNSAVPCSRPHTLERLGWAALPVGSIGADTVTHSCRLLAVRLLRTSDPTRGGALRILTTTANVITCAAVLVGPGRLAGSLIGVGSGPLPFVG